LPIDISGAWEPAADADWYAAPPGRGECRVARGEDAASRLRDICLSLPEPAEKSCGGHTAPSLRIGAVPELADLCPAQPDARARTANIRQSGVGSQAGRRS
jgi:hypothetical protein